jgi:hypothetical protein
MKVQRDERLVVKPVVIGEEICTETIGVARATADLGQWTG